MVDLELIGLPVSRDEKRRDAIHVAIVAIKNASDKSLMPGDSVKLSNPSSAVPCVIDERVGVVDPFLRDGIDPGGKFWLFLEPGSISDMRHVWTHPAFHNASRSENGRS